MPGAPGYILAGEASVSASPEQVVDLLKGVATRKDLPGAAREYALTALMKLSARLPGTVASVQVCTEWKPSITVSGGEGIKLGDRAVRWADWSAFQLEYILCFCGCKLHLASMRSMPGPNGGVAMEQVSPAAEDLTYAKFGDQGNPESNSQG